MSSIGSDRDAAESLENNDYLLNRLFNGYVFHIPEYQRFYSWDRSHWDDLWNDLHNMVDELNRDHYMGTVICKDENNAIETEEYTTNYREYGIVDGQQRFTTLVLLVKAIVDIYELIDPDALSEQAHERYEKLPVADTRALFVRDRTMTPGSEGYEARNKLKLQQEDNRVFKAILRNDVATATIDTPSQRRLVDAYEFYTQRLEELREKQSEVAFLDQIGRFLSGIQSLQFMLYTIDDQAQATLIFESINDRGKGLSKLDKTKSFLMHKVYLARPDDGVSDITINDVQSRFGQVYRSLQTIDDTDRTSGLSEDRIQQYHYVATIDRSVNTAYINSETDRRNRTLRSGAPVYLDALKWHFTRLYDNSESDPYASYPRDCLDDIDWYTDGLKRYYWHMERIATYGNEEDDPDIAWELTKLFSLGRLGNFYPLLLALWDEYHKDRLTRNELHDILQLIEVASFRIYSVADRRSDTGESQFYNLANDIATGNRGATWIIDQIKDDIRSLEYDFADSLRNQNAYDKFSFKDIRYLLYSYELYLRETEMGGAAPSMERAVENAGKEYSIDHIRPNDTSRLNLTEEEERNHDDSKHALGNLTLTTGPRNASWKNRPYEEKRELDEDEWEDDEDRPVYMSSDFEMTRNIAREYDTWGPGRIEARLGDLIEYAEKRWSLDADVRDEYASIRPSEID